MILQELDEWMTMRLVKICHSDDHFCILSQYSLCETSYLDTYWPSDMMLPPSTSAQRVYSVDLTISTHQGMNLRTYKSVFKVIRPINTIDGKSTETSRPKLS
jgi:hypothetical protein